MTLGGGTRKNKRKAKKAGSMLSRAALPGLLTLALLSRGKKRKGTRKGMSRKSARKAYMKKGGTRRRR
tara:strand:- start:2787 stop:2990 length:204 start_codon:yes stop_codon:yes gene_type:complete